MSDFPRACLTCRWFSLSFGEQGYSELTPGSSPSIECERNAPAWVKAFGRYPMGGAGAVEAWNFRSVAEECDQFEPHDLLVGSAP